MESYNDEKYREAQAERESLRGSVPYKEPIEPPALHLLEIVTIDARTHKQYSFWNAGDANTIDRAMRHHTERKIFSVSDRILMLRRYDLGCPKEIQLVVLDQPEDEEKKFYENAAADALHQRPGRGVDGILEDVKLVSAKEA